MNVSSTADVMMKQLICSSVARKALVDGQSSPDIAPLLMTDQEKNDYLCECCLVPCGKCSGGLDNGGDITSVSSLGSIISGRMSALTDPTNGADLFSPNGQNGDMFSSNAFWEQATKYFNMVCVKDCAADYKTVESESRPYEYAPSADSGYATVWNKILNGPSNSLTSTLKSAASTAFKFKALPKSMCPYEDPAVCVPMPGVAFEEITPGSEYCTFKMSAEVVAAVSGAVADAFSSVGGTAFTEGAGETFGKWAGDFQRSVDTLIVVALLSFVVGLVFLVLLRFFVGVCVWLAVFSTVLIFFFGGSFLFALSAQCNGASLWDTTTQAYTRMAVSGTSAVSNAVSGTAPDETITGDGAAYKGVQTVTITGKKCLPWDTQNVLTQYRSSNYPNSNLVSNYCRNPYTAADPNKASTIWCITSDPNVAWEECLPVGVILPACKHGYAISGEKMRDALFYSSFVVWAFGLIWLIVIFCFVRRIMLAIALNKVAAQFVGGNPTILLVPIVQAVIGVAWCIIWFYSASFLLSQVPADYTPTERYATYAEAYGTSSACPFWEWGDHCVGTPGKCTDKWPVGSVWKDSTCDVVKVDGVVKVAKCWRCAPPRYVLDLRFFVSFFVFLWNNAFNVAMGQILVAMACAMWFFQTEKGVTPVVCKALKTVCRYHIGSVALGSFIVAVVEFIRYVMKYFEKQAAAQKNRVMVYILKCVQCCIWCFEQCIKFLNKNAYIQIALLGKNFCSSAKTAFFLILRNFARFGTMAALGSVISLIGFLFIIAGTTVIGYFILREMHPEVSPFIPVVCFLFIGYVVSKVYMSVFCLAVDTSLQCFLAVEESGNGAEFVPSVLSNFVQDHKTAPDEE
eukprot:TRINITY_DN3773_c0_g1_i2.p1 TRINITY_DN3773_c0_g1~~TRINITY_DN3773_c0_g1_i2.p1  ORF type:complete len:854 (+),score=131.49 TRINITY_DN3773_c0_g1_i2:355-2916(+)